MPKDNLDNSSSTAVSSVNNMPQNKSRSNAVSSTKQRNSNNAGVTSISQERTQRNTKATAKNNAAVKRNNNNKKDDKKEKTPLIKFEGEDGDATYSMKRAVLVMFSIVFGIAVVIYVFGLLFSLTTLTMISFVVLLIDIFVTVMMMSRINKSAYDSNEELIDAKVEQYKIDLIDTCVGYGLEYDKETIIASADAYRKELEAENASLTDLRSDSFKNVAQAMLEDSKRNKAAKKAQKRNRK